MQDWALAAAIAQSSTYMTVLTWRVEPYKPIAALCVRLLASPTCLRCCAAATQTRIAQRRVVRTVLIAHAQAGVCRTPLAQPCALPGARIVLSTKLKNIFNVCCLQIRIRAGQSNRILENTITPAARTSLYKLYFRPRRCPVPCAAFATDSQSKQCLHSVWSLARRRPIHFVRCKCIQVARDLCRRLIERDLCRRLRFPL